MAAPIVPDLNRLYRSAETITLIDHFSLFDVTIQPVKNYMIQEE
ncbi:MAG: hypothetical protein ACR2PH_02260 [Desulfobulbia bacterium]